MIKMDASLSIGKLLYSAPSSFSLVLHMGLVNREILSASESANDVPSYKLYTARQTDMIT
jgi:hypothetical protein